MNYNVMTLSFCGVYFFFINNNLYNEIYKLKQNNFDLQNTLEKRIIVYNNFCNTCQI